jgi:uncharacterized protein (DUF2384 family)
LLSGVPQRIADSSGITYSLVVQEIRANGVTSAELAEITGVRERQVQHWVAGSSKPRDASRERLTDVYYVINQLQDVYRPEGVEIWLHARNRDLSGRRPIDLLRSGEFSPVLEAVERLTHGAMG